ncbi:Transcriptional regulator, AbiEi antitoxin, Type IV TA system [Blastococcus sp. DSM 46786]|nr:Transcriptional regulator, AbiEi antitoxin, Type IV TA system [Blastococcus sp. DSM 46786]
MFRGRDVVADGVLTRDELRSSAWRRLFHGVYADARLPESFGLRVRGARLLAPSCAVFCGRTAAYLHGVTGVVDADSPVELVVPTSSRAAAAAGLVVRRAAIEPSDLTQSGPFRFTTGLRTAVDIARVEPLLDAVPALDALVAARVVGLVPLAGAAAGLHGVRGAHRCRRAVSLVDPRAESPQESRLRVVLALAGLPAVPQHVVRDADGFVARVDLAFPELRIAIEYDGAWHGAPAQLRRDRRRLNRLVAAGWTVLHVTAADLQRPEGLLAQLRSLVVAAERRRIGG